MAKAGDELINPVTGLKTVFRKTAQETDGELLRVDWIGSRGWTTGPDHVHPLREERFEVLSGRLGLRTEVAFETLAGLARDGKTNAAGAPKNPLLLALVLRHFEDEIYFVRPLGRPEGRLRPARRARLALGYRAEHPYPYPDRVGAPRVGADRTSGAER